MKEFRGDFPKEPILMGLIPTKNVAVIPFIRALRKESNFLMQNHSSMP